MKIFLSELRVTLTDFYNNVLDLLNCCLCFPQVNYILHNGLFCSLRGMKYACHISELYKFIINKVGFQNYKIVPRLLMVVLLSKAFLI